MSISRQPKRVPKSERIVSLAMFLSSREGTPATRTDIAHNIEAYHGLLDDDPSAKKQLMRDLDTLRELGIYVVVDDDEMHADGEGGKLTFTLDSERSFMSDMRLDAADATRLRLASLTPLSDPTFAYACELRSAITKISGVAGDMLRIQMPETPPDNDERAGELDAVRKLDTARAARKAVTFSYEKADGTKSNRRVHPYGLFSIRGDWYCICFDPSRDGFREFRVSRMRSIKQPSRSSKPDYEPVPFDLHDYIRFPFVYGDEPEFEVVFGIPANLRREPSYLWDDMEVRPCKDDPTRLLAKTRARSAEACARWAIEQGPGVIPLAPPKVLQVYLDGLREVADG